VRSFFFTSAAFVLAFLMGCHTPSSVPYAQVAPPPQTRPHDFVLAATVIGPTRTVEPVGLPRSLKPARYIVEADGCLRAATGPGSDEQTFPPRSRQLTPRQADQLWRLVLDSGLLDPASPVRVQDVNTIERPTNRTIALLWISYADSATTLRVPLDRAARESLAAEQIVDCLAEWAWVRD
jgi:hypothetical protein